VWALRLAAVHCAAWGLFSIALPGLSADVYGFDGPLTDQFLWQGTGLIILLFGCGYGIASTSPRIHWAVVAVGLAAKILGPIGMASAVWRGEVASDVLLLIPVNDIIWWIPFSVIVYRGITRQCAAD
jgi:hypothetical protein